MTYGDIEKRFIEVTNIDVSAIDDYRPYIELFDVPNISGAIIIWLKNGDKIIYVPKSEKK
ncbi:MAG: hypothetical protein K9L62_01945 [Vallitaleaceae bacterium]|nr:hypothetical protein [Vallitaleaceae bacterium]